MLPPSAGAQPSLADMDAVVFASRTGVRLELVPAPWPYRDDAHAMPTWAARLSGNGLEVTLVCPEAGWRPQFLADFLASLDEDWRGWDGERVWESGESELKLIARHDKTNTVVIGVVLREGAPPRWTCQADLELDPGCFRALAADARRLGQVSLSL